MKILNRPIYKNIYFSFYNCYVYVLVITFIRGVFFIFDKSFLSFTMIWFFSFFWSLNTNAPTLVDELVNHNFSEKKKIVSNVYCFFGTLFLPFLIIMCIYLKCDHLFKRYIVLITMNKSSYLYWTVTVCLTELLT